MIESDREADDMVHKKAPATDAQRADVPRREKGRTLATLGALAKRIGNTAAARLFGARGRSLEESGPKLRSAFGAQAEGVRVVDDAESHAAARALDATAFTTGDTIFLGDRAPSPSTAAGEALLAHELAHVVQQRNASEVKSGEVSSQHDSFEKSADVAAQSFARGDTPSIAAGGAVPGVQRQTAMADPKLAYRSQVERAIESYLRRALLAQGGQTLHRSDAVFSAMRMLAQADDPRWRGRGPDPKKIGRIMAVESLVTGPMFGGKPGELAKSIAALLPNPFDPAALERLNQMPAADAAPKGGAGVMALIERTTPTTPALPDDPAAKSLETVTPRGQQADAQARDEHMVNAPVSQAAEIGRGFKGAVKGTPPKPKTTQGEETKGAVAQVPAYPPAPQARGPLPDANQVSLDLMRSITVAHEGRKSSADLHLDASLARAKDQMAIMAELERIVGLVRPAVPKPTSVREVRVFFGDQMVKVIRLSEPAVKK